MALTQNQLIAQLTQGAKAQQLQAKGWSPAKIAKMSGLQKVAPALQNSPVAKAAAVQSQQENALAPMQAGVDSAKVALAAATQAYNANPSNATASAMTKAMGDASAAVAGAQSAGVQGGTDQLNLITTAIGKDPAFMAADAAANN